MSDEKDRFGDKLHQAEMARENQWARQRDAEILEGLHRQRVKADNCPKCGGRLEAGVAIGVGEMACPSHHGAWADGEALEQLSARLENAAAIHHESLGEKVSGGFADIVEGLRHRHLMELECPDCGAKLSARLVITPGTAGLVGMACPNRHGAWIDQDMLRDICNRLSAAVQYAQQRRDETHK